MYMLRTCSQQIPTYESFCLALQADTQWLTGRDMQVAAQNVLLRIDHEQCL
jgi:hypothetical protein